MFDSPKWSIRYDTGDGELGPYYVGGEIIENVSWGNKGYRVKGDFHNITGNLGLVNWKEDEADSTISLIHQLSWEDSRVENENTTLWGNAFWHADSGKYKTEETNGNGKWPLTGIKFDNYYGNTSHAPGETSDGTWILNGTNIGIPEVDLPDLLMDVHQYDFRPKPGTILTSTGVRIGPYAEAYSDVTKYNIPGRKNNLASHPIPSHESNVKMRDALIFRPAFR